MSTSSAGVSLQVNIHALNESPTIRQVVEAVPRHIAGVATIRIVVVDDGSTDETAALARSAGASVLGWQRNRGLGRSYHRGLSHALENDCDILVTMDGDGQFDPRQIPALLAPVLRDEADMATCSRFADPTLVPAMPRWKRFGNHLVARLVSSLTMQRFTDVSCGFRAYNRECLLRLNLMGGFTYTHEAIMELCFKGMRVVEVPLAVRGEREFGNSRMARNAWQYGIRSLRVITGTLLNHRPDWVFGGAAVGAGVLGVACSIVGSIPWFTRGVFIKSLMLIGGFLLGLTVLLTLFALQSRAVKRSQFLLESILFELRSRDSGKEPRP